MTPRIVAIGDSLIYGRHDASGGGWIGRLRARLEGDDKGAAVFNLGIGGETSRDLLQRFERECWVREPNAIVIGVGANDSRREATIDGDYNVPPAEFTKNLDAILRSARNKIESTVFVASVMPIDESRHKFVDNCFYTNDTLHNYFSIQQALCADHKTNLLNFWEVIEGASADVYSDGLHLNSRGHEELANYSHAAITKVFRA